MSLPREGGGSGHEVLGPLIVIPPSAGTGARTVRRGCVAARARRIEFTMAYFDHAATTPMLPEAVQAMTAQLAVTGNASSLHAAGRQARRTVEEAREAFAEVIGARPSEGGFTSGGTEADNLALKGLDWARRAVDPGRTRVLASRVEHHAVLDAVQWLAHPEGARIAWLPVDAYGRVDPGVVAEAIARHP